MRKLLNTLYVTNPDVYLTKDSENIVARIDDKEVMRVPALNIESIVCMNRLGASPYLMNLCAERVAALNMYIQSGQTKIKRMIAFRDNPPKNNGGMPCGACREFFMQLAYENRDMEILTDYETRKTVLLKDIIPNWWGDKRYNKE